MNNILIAKKLVAIAQQLLQTKAAVNEEDDKMFHAFMEKLLKAEDDINMFEEGDLGWGGLSDSLRKLPSSMKLNVSRTSIEDCKNKIELMIEEMKKLMKDPKREVYYGMSDDDLVDEMLSR